MLIQELHRDAATQRVTDDRRRLDPQLVEQVFEIIQTINKLGTTIFVVEQNANMALSIATRGYVLQTGEVVLSGRAKDLLQNEMLRATYLGEMKTA